MPAPIPTLKDMKEKVASLVSCLPEPTMSHANGGEAYFAWLLKAECMTVSCTNASLRAVSDAYEI